MPIVSGRGWNMCMPYVMRLVEDVGGLMIDSRSVVSQLRPPMNIFLHFTEAVSICT
jgi:hypothetical protein